MSRRIGFLRLLIILGFLQASPCWAQADGQSILRDAEQALIDIDFNAAGNLAEKALKTGSLDNPKDTSRARYLMGIGQAYADNVALAKEQFRIAISINPDLPVDSSLGPSLQSPFLEARGELAVRKEYLGAEVNIEEGSIGPVVSIAVTDPALTAKTAQVSLRPSFYESETRRKFSSEKTTIERLRAELALASLGIRDQDEIEDEIQEFNLTVSLEDEHGNVVYKLGSEKLPETRGNPYFSEPTAFEELVSSPFFWIGTVVVVGAAGGLVYAFAIAPPERVGVVSSTR